MPKKRARAKPNENDPAGIADAIDRFVKHACDYVNWRITANIVAKAGAEARAIDPGYGERVLKNLENSNQARADMLKVGRPLAASLAALGEDCSLLLDLLHTGEVYGGGAEAARPIWKRLRTPLEQLALRLRAGKLPEAAGAEAAQPASDSGYLTPSELARKFGVESENARKALATWRKKHGGGDGFIENQDARPTEARFAYRLQDVCHVMERLQSFAVRRKISRKKSSGNLPSRE